MTKLSHWDNYIGIHFFVILNYFPMFLTFLITPITCVIFKSRLLAQCVEFCFHNSLENGLESASHLRCVYLLIAYKCMVCVPRFY